MKIEQVTLMHNNLGFIAALDQSGGSTPKALLQYGVQENEYSGNEEMYTAVHAMRSRIIKSPAFTSKHILAAILFENTMDRYIDDKYTADYLWEVKGILPILKVDQGLADLENGVQLMKPIPNLDALLERAAKRNIFGTKMRSLIKEANAEGIKKIVDQQFKIGIQIANTGLVPILEPEVDIHMENKEEAEKLLLNEIKEHLATLGPETKLMFKLSIPNVDGFYTGLMHDEHVVRVVALSGGYSQTEANNRVLYNHTRNS